MEQMATEHIPAQDWEATPVSVRKVLLSLEQERNAFREKLEALEHARGAGGEEFRRRLRRYHSLVEQQFLTGLTPEQQQEIERLGEQIDTANAAFYPSLSSLAEAIAARTGTQPE